MRKHIAILFVALLGLSAPAAAQFRSIMGVVVDQNNQPISGAKVKVPFTRKKAVTDKNGRFSIPVMEMPKKVRVSSRGKNSLLLPSSENMHIRLTDRTVGQWEADSWHTFVGLDMASYFSGSATNDVYFSQHAGVTTRSLGLTAGITDSRMGFYVKGHFVPLNGDDDFEISSKRNCFDVVLGGIVHVWEPLYCNLGIGALFYTERSHHISQFTVTDGYTDEKKKKMPIIDFGLSGRYRHFQLHAGVLTALQCHEWHPYIGVSYIF